MTDINWANLLVIAGLVVHFAFHIVATVGIVIGLIHSHRVHGAQLWKLAATLLWLFVSLFVLWNGRHEFFETGTAHCEHTGERQ